MQSPLGDHPEQKEEPNIAVLGLTRSGNPRCNSGLEERRVSTSYTRFTSPGPPGRVLLPLPTSPNPACVPGLLGLGSASSSPASPAPAPRPAYQRRWNSCFCSTAVAKAFFLFMKPSNSCISFSQEARSGFLASSGP